MSDCGWNLHLRKQRPHTKGAIFYRHRPPCINSIPFSQETSNSTLELLCVPRTGETNAVGKQIISVRGRCECALNQRTTINKYLESRTRQERRERRETGESMRVTIIILLYLCAALQLLD